MGGRNPNCDICSILDSEDYLITETRYWRVVLCENQEYLGRSYVTLKRHSPNLSELTKEEWLDLKTLITTLEAAFKKAFNATYFNWACSMNDAYKHQPAYPHVHWHLRPRYTHEVKFVGMVFKDPEFGHHYTRVKDRILNLPEKQLLKIAEEVKKQLPHIR